MVSIKLLNFNGKHWDYYTFLFSFFHKIRWKKNQPVSRISSVNQISEQSLVYIASIHKALWRHSLTYLTVDLTLRDVDVKTLWGSLPLWLHVLTTLGSHTVTSMWKMWQLWQTSIESSHQILTESDSKKLRSGFFNTF